MQQWHYSRAWPKRCAWCGHDNNGANATLPFWWQTPSRGYICPCCNGRCCRVWYYHRHALHGRITWKYYSRGQRLALCWEPCSGNTSTIMFLSWWWRELFWSVLALWFGWSVIEVQMFPTNKWFGMATGILGGFTSMIGNLAERDGVFALLSMRMPKHVSPSERPYGFVINWFKVPFHVFVENHYAIYTFVWSNYTSGNFIGRVARWSLRGSFRKTYRWFIIVMTLAAAIFMIAQLRAAYQQFNTDHERGFLHHATLIGVCNVSRIKSHRMKNFYPLLASISVFSIAQTQKMGRQYHLDQAYKIDSKGTIAQPERCQCLLLQEAAEPMFTLRDWPRGWNPRLCICSTGVHGWCERIERQFIHPRAQRLIIIWRGGFCLWKIYHQLLKRPKG